MSRYGGVDDVFLLEVAQIIGGFLNFFGNVFGYAGIFAASEKGRTGLFDQTFDSVDNRKLLFKLIHHLILISANINIININAKIQQIIISESRNNLTKRQNNVQFEHYQFGEFY